MLRSAIIAMIVGDGGAPPVMTRIARGNGCAAGWWASITRTVGAPQKWVTPPSSNIPQACAGSTRGMQTLFAPTAESAHGYVHPLQWNIGSVHRYTESRVTLCSVSIANALRYAPRWVYTTPFGRPVVPDV